MDIGLPRANARELFYSRNGVDSIDSWITDVTSSPSPIVLVSISEEKEIGQPTGSGDEPGRLK